MPYLYAKDCFMYTAAQTRQLQQQTVALLKEEFPAATEAFEAASLPYQSLTDYPSLIELALKKGIVSPAQEEILLKWRENPAAWTGS